ncbi:alpha-N-acetylgalactosaminide alpha-2,6-sialyltransferase 2-like [Salminus brasiliensis]|uniref:alpha-N-acetylgalactosaminide alpha-2,6-sialyltransferase 2-like n=1 Tax=Salminus brasiliensis TaxID=930266 RepID=UPI003B82CB48
MATFPTLTPFRLMMIVLYITVTVWIYMLLTESFVFRKQFQHGSLFRSQDPPDWQWVEMNNTKNAPQMKVNMMWKPAKDMKESKHNSKALKKPTAEAPKAKAQHGLPNNDQRGSKDLGDEGRSSTGSQINHLKDSQRSLNKAPLNQTGPTTSTKSSIISPATIPRSTLQRKLTPIPVMFKKNFKKMPSWKTNDVYLRSEESFQMDCAESVRKSKDPDFQKSFIPNIKMYLYQNQLNLSEWNRLAHFNNPFGFMEYNYSEIKSAVNLIPKPSVTQLLPLPANDSCIRCAVVANGGILRGSKKGKEIDSHEYVFRMNGAVTKGHEEDVGHRTSVYVHTAFSLVTSLIAYRKYGFNNIPNDKDIKLVMIPEGLRDFQWLQGLLSRQEVKNGEFGKKKPWTYYAGQFDESRFYVLHPDFLRYIRNRFMTSKQQNGKHWALYRPTNGAFTLFLALHVCDIVDAYGFITENYQKYSNYYFQDKKTNVIFYINHDYNLEIRLWKKLHDAKIIRLYQREGGRR